MSVAVWLQVLGDVLATNKLGTAAELLVDPLAFNNAGKQLCASDGDANCAFQINKSTSESSGTNSENLVNITNLI